MNTKKLFITPFLAVLLMSPLPSTAEDCFQQNTGVTTDYGFSCADAAIVAYTSEFLPGQFVSVLLSLHEISKAGVNCLGPLDVCPIQMFGQGVLVSTQFGIVDTDVPDPNPSLYTFANGNPPIFGEVDADWALAPGGQGGPPVPTCGAWAAGTSGIFVHNFGPGTSTHVVAEADFMVFNFQAGCVCT